MTERTHSSAGLLPVPDRYGLWGLSISRAVAGGGHSRSRNPLRALALTATYAALFLGLYAVSIRSVGMTAASAWNLPLGLSLGILIGHGPACLPLVLAGYLAAPMLVGVPMSLPGTIAAGLSQTSALALGLAVTRYLAAGRSRDLTDRRSFAAFAVAAPLVSALGPGLEVLYGVAVPEMASLAGESAAPAFWGNLTGIWLMGPLSVMSAVLASRRGSRCLEGLRTRPEHGGLRKGTSGASPWTYAWRVAALAGIFSTSLYLILKLPSPGEFLLFSVVSVPLVATACVFGLCGVAPLLAVLGLTALAQFPPGSELTVSMQMVSVAAAMNSAALGLLVTLQRRYQYTMNHQAALIDSVSFATEQLLGMTDQEKNVNEVLGNLAGGAGLGRVYILENRQNAQHVRYPVLYEMGSGLDSDQRDRVSAVLEKHIRRCAGSLALGNTLELDAGELTPDEQAVFSRSGISGTLILPIFADGHWWGCLGMDQRPGARSWSRPEIATFEATARVLGALLAHTNVEQQFRQFTGSIPVVFYIAAPDVFHRTYVSPAYEQIWGRSRDAMRENPRSWMAAIYHDDYARISAVLESNPTAEYAEEYRIVGPDRSVRWIRDTGFPVVDATGQVNRIVGIAQDITAQKEAEERLKASEEQIRTSLNEKEVLLKEIHHRVKNNLQVISSLLNLQATQIRDGHAAAVFKDSQTRVRAMALVHERLYQSADLARIDFAGYVRDMTSHLLRSYQSESRGVRLVLEVESLQFDVDMAIPCALIINELVSNALKYAFPEGREGQIAVSLSEKGDGAVSLVISDNGVGLPEGASFETSESLGLQLVRSLTDQLGGTVECSGRQGTRFEVRFRPADDAGVERPR